MENIAPFHISTVDVPQVPIIVSVPHCGTVFPEQLKKDFKPELLTFTDDTDWYVDKLYDFVPSMGIPMISAVYHRWVIDLNRDPAGKPLYSDGRLITGLCPVTTFTGEKLYGDEREAVADDDQKIRVEKYFKPYHDALQNLLSDTLRRFGKVLLWDCHSIRQAVPTIHPKKFPDLILGDNDGFAAGPFLTEMATKSLTAGAYSFENNYLFKGGYITRNYGKPEVHQHALQLEMTKVNYMNDAQRQYDTVRADKMRDHLKRTFEKLITVLNL
jgi:N-formylglutamate deformylase